MIEVYCFTILLIVLGIGIVYSYSIHAEKISSNIKERDYVIDCNCKMCKNV